MHPLRHPRNAAAVGIIFIFVAFALLIVPASQGMPLDLVAAGVTMLLFLAVAMAIMAYVLVAGSAKE
jgi:hypothetical protein